MTIEKAVEPAQPYNGEEWEMLAMALAAEEHGDIHHLIWEGGPVPEPWGEVWQRYEGEAKRLIALVRLHAPAHPYSEGTASPDTQAVEILRHALTECDVPDVYAHAIIDSFRSRARSIAGGAR